jgi:alkylhydroperoxidase family enzyme
MESHERDLRSESVSDEQVRAIQNDYQTAGLSARERALLDSAIKLTNTPPVVKCDDLDPLRRHG